MTDRYSGFLVALDRDMREDDAEAVLTALRMVKGVISVDPIVADGREQIAEIRVRREIRERIYRALGGLDG